MPKRVLCKFSAHGACLKGDHCEFSHDWKAPPNNICTFYQKGICAYGSRCRYEHIIAAETAIVNADAGDCPCTEPDIQGDNCPTYGKQCLNPFKPQEEDHVKLCEKRKKYIEALRKSQEIECCVCLDRVLLKPTLPERKFGILPECDHPYCISCIRTWRSSSRRSGLDVNSALRTCPVCRKRSYFVVPSVTWYSSTEEKQDIIDNYKAKLRTIDCKHFNFGNGTCPFGGSCFYKHARRDASLEKVVLQFLGSGEEDTSIAKNMRLSSILSNLQIR